MDPSAQQIPLFSVLDGKPSRSIYRGQATVQSLKLLLRGNASCHGNSRPGLRNTWQKTPADGLESVSTEPQTCNFSVHFFLIPQCPRPGFPADGNLKVLKANIRQRFDSRENLIFIRIEDTFKF